MINHDLAVSTREPAATPFAPRPLKEAPPAESPPHRGRVSQVVGVVRIGTALGLIGLSLWALLLPPIFPASSHAIVNTKVVTIRAREAGRIENVVVAGRAEPLPTGAKIATVTRDEDALRRQQQELEFSRLKFRERLESVERTVAATDMRLTELNAGLETSRQSARRLLARSREILEEKVRAGREDLVEKKALESRVEPLFRDGIVTSGQWAQTREQTLLADKGLRAAETELAAAEEATVADAHTGFAVVEARQSALEGELSTLRLHRIELAAGLAEVDARLAALAERRGAGLAYDLNSPIEGVVWRRHVVRGESVAEGQTLAEVADSGSLFVEAYFRRDFINSISVGDRASVYLIDTGRFVNGRVTDVSAQERTSKEPDVINTVSLDAAMLRVRVEVDGGTLRPAELGQLARVLVSNGTAGRAEQILLRTSFLLRGSR